MNVIQVVQQLSFKTLSEHPTVPFTT